MGNDAELLESWRSGNQRAGEILLSRYFDSLYRFFASKLDGCAEELIQRTLLACVERTHDVSNSPSFRAYLFTVARLELLAQMRGVKPKRSGDNGVTSIWESADSEGTLMVERPEQKLLLKGLRQLPIDLQIVLGLFYWEGLSNAELASVVDMQEGAIKSGLGQARDQLEGRMRALADSAELLRSTVDNLDAWVSSLAAEPK